MSKSKSTIQAIIGIELLQVALIVLKLAEIGQVKIWPWWVVLSLTWVPIAAILAILIIYAICVLFIIFFKDAKRSKYH